MSPSPLTDKVLLALVGKAMGEWEIDVVLIRSLGPLEMARMRASGQLDCGKRQSLVPLQVRHLKSTTVDKLFEENLINQDNDLLEFGGGMFSSGGQPREEARRALEIICQMEPRFSQTEIDRTIPCS